MAPNYVFDHSRKRFVKVYRDEMGKTEWGESWRKGLERMEGMNRNGDAFGKC
jgi:hypothetical protein